MNHFDWIAPVYDRLAVLVFDQRLDQAQEVFLNEIPPGSRVLVLGGGTGKIVAAILKASSDCRITFVDASEAMLQRAKKRNQDFPTVEFIHGTEEAVPSGARYDIVITPFYLDMFPDDQLSGIVGTISRFISAGGKWLVTDFYAPVTIWQHWLTKMMYLFFRITAGISARSLPDWKNVLKNNGWVEKNHSRDGFIESAVFMRANQGN